MAPADRDDQAGGEDLSKRLAGRTAAALFIGCGLITVVSMLLPVAPTVNRSALALIGAVAVLVGAVIWMLPWYRWPRAASLWVILPAFILIALHNHYYGAQSYRYSLFFLVAFTWLGLSHPRGTPACFVPLMAVAYVVPLITAGSYTPWAAASVLAVAAVCALVGETIAWVSDRLRRAQQDLTREIGERRRGEEEIRRLNAGLEQRILERTAALDRALTEADLLNAITRQASGEDDLSEILSRSLDHLRRVIPFTGGSVALLEGDDLVVRAAVGPFAPGALGQRLNRGKGRSWQVVADAEPFLCNDLEAAGLMPTTPIRSYLAVPLTWRTRAFDVTFGVLEVDSTETNQFTPAHLALMQQVALALSGPIQLAVRYAAEARAVAEGKRTQRSLQVQYAVTRALIEAPTLAAASPTILQAVCESLGWQLGGLWVVDREAGGLRCAQMWHAPAIDVAAFIDLSLQTTFPPGVGLPGRVWASGQPAWIPDVVADTNFPRAPVAARVGLHAAFGFPIRIRGATFGMIEFFSQEIREPDDDLLNMMTAIGNQIGQFIERKRTEESLRESEARKAAILETSLDCIITMDHQGRIMEFNPAAEKTFGYSRAEAVGREMAGLIVPPSLREQHRRGLAHYLATGEGPVLGQRIELSAIRADGTEFPVELAITRIPSDGPPMFTGYVRDITERRQVEQEQRKLVSLVEHSPDFIGIGALDGQVLYINPAGRQLVGLPSGDAVRATAMADYVPPEDLAEFRERILPAVVGEGSWEGEFRFRQFATGATIPIHFNVFLIKDARGQPIALATVSRDITRSKMIEDTLREAKEEAETASRAKSEFLSRMSHELRTPMNAILGFAQLLEMDSLSVEQGQYLAHILQSGRHLLRLIDELLDIGRIEAGRLDLTLGPVLLPEVLQEALTLVRPLAADRQVRIESRAAETFRRPILADRQRLTQVLLNLLTNAVKYNHRGGTVTLSCEETSMRRVRIRISDTGPGVAADRLARLFIPFERLGAEQTDIGGTGIGLALSKRLVEAMHGAIGVESTLGQGSTFWVDLPPADTLIPSGRSERDRE